MKKLLLSAILIITFIYCSGQTRLQLTPTGLVKSFAPMTSLTGSSENVIMADTVLANTIAKNQNFHFKAICRITTTGINISTLTINIKVGSNTVVLTSGLNIALAQTNKPFVIEGYIVNQGNGNAYVYAYISQDGTTPINTVVSYYDKDAVFAINFASNQTFQITSTVAGLGLGNTTLTVMWTKRDNL